MVYRKGAADRFLNRASVPYICVGKLNAAGIGLLQLGRVLLDTRAAEVVKDMHGLILSQVTER
jgi:hypothetical protein